MSLLQLLAVDCSVGGPLLLDAVDFSLDQGERVCVVGRNGAGKSTLLRLLDRSIAPEAGEVRWQDGLRVTRLAQEVPQNLGGSVREVVAAGLGALGEHLAAFHRAAAARDLAAMAREQAALDAGDGWELDQRVERALSRLGLEADTEFAALSGGGKRRALLARALVAEPDVLLLDEPTNHLDLAAIEGLQELVRTFPGAVVFVTHDRRFLQELATRIVEIDRGRLTDWPGDWVNYLRRRAEREHAEELADARFDRRLREEEAWIRQGIKARRTRNEGRVRALKAMRRERAARRERTGTATMQLVEAGASARKVIEARNLDFSWNGRPVVAGFSTLVLRGDRVGIIGPNGSGKTTLIRLLLGQLVPDRGEVLAGPGLEIAWFDQHREQLDESLSALDNVAEGREYIELGDRRLHIIGYLQNFLFTPERARAPITRLSGGERNRLLLARLFSRPSNLLVLDEPTNDLDMETLELLEELLDAYKGTLLLVSHDREFLDNVVTSTLVMEGEGRVGEYVGGYSDWLRQRSEPAPAAERRVRPARQPAPRPAARRRSYREQQELDGLPARIEQLEGEIEARGRQMADPGFYRQDGNLIAAAGRELEALQEDLAKAYARWEELDTKSS